MRDFRDPDENSLANSSRHMADRDEGLVYMLSETPTILPARV
jgi:hypothetical protein